MYTSTLRDNAFGHVYVSSCCGFQLRVNKCSSHHLARGFTVNTGLV